MFLRLFIIFFFVLCCLCTTQISAQPLCTPSYIDHQIEEVTATANAFSNSIKAAGSLSYETKRLLDKALSVQNSLHAPLTPCSAPCSAGGNSVIVFSTAPHKILTDYSEKDRCQELQRKTSSEPLTFNPDLFTDMDKFSTWFADFSRGSGREGKELYRLCPGACSPQYLVDLNSEQGKVQALVRVICGEARDKTDNQYNVSTTLRWTCALPN